MNTIKHKLVTSRTYLVCIVLVLLIFVSACTGGKIKDDSYEIGAVLMLTGSSANWGINAQRGIQLAIEDINGKGGIDGTLIRVSYEDNGDNEPAVAVSAFHKLLSEGTTILVGPQFVTSSLAVASLACEQHVLVISPSAGSPDFHKTCDYLFDLWPNDDLLSAELAKYLYDNGHRKIAILGSLDSWDLLQAENVKMGFEDLGGDVVSYNIVAPDEQDFGAVALKIKESDAEAVIFTNYAYQHLSAKRMREMGIELPFYPVVIDGEKIRGAQGAFEGTVLFNTFTPSEEFVRDYEEAYGEKPDSGADGAYDSVMLIAEAIENTGSTDATVLKDYLKALESYDGASGTFTFNEYGNVVKKPQTMIIRHDEMVLYSI